MEGSSGGVRILCCMCGISIEANPSNSCASCLASRTDVTKGISTEATLHQCRGCQRWHGGGGKWIGCELESRELMALCLENVSGLRTTNSSKTSRDRIRLVDAGWVWTEPHSMRLKIRLTIQREVQSGTILQQSFLVTFIVRNQQCIECQAEFRQGSWKSLVQVRQRVSHKRTFLFLEQLILKHGAHRGCLSIETFRDGMDFYFPDKAKAARFISFLENVVPIKVKHSKKLIGTDDKSNISNFKYTNYVELCPLCKDDLLYLPAKLAASLGNINRLVLVRNVSNLIHLIDPITGQTAALTPEKFWRDPFRPLIPANRTRFTRYIILGKEPLVLPQTHQQNRRILHLSKSNNQHASKKTPTQRNRNKMAMLHVAREVDLGQNNHQYQEPSHIGYLMKCGDVCVGYDLTDKSQWVDDHAEQAREQGKLPSVVLVRKLYGAAAAAALASPDDTEDDATTASITTNRSKRRLFRLQRLDVDTSDAAMITDDDDDGAKSRRLRQKEQRKQSRKRMDALESDHMDEEDFLREVEADREMRSQINLYRSDYALTENTPSTKNTKSPSDQTATETNNKKEEIKTLNDNDEDDEDDQEVQLDELLDGLILDDGPDPKAATTTTTTEQSFSWQGDENTVEEGQRAAKDGLAYAGRDEARRLNEKESAVPVKGNAFSKDFFG